MKNKKIVLQEKQIIQDLKTLDIGCSEEFKEGLSRRLVARYAVDERVALPGWTEKLLGKAIMMLLLGSALFSLGRVLSDADFDLVVIPALIFVGLFWTILLFPVLLPKRE